MKLEPRILVSALGTLTLWYILRWLMLERRPRAKHGEEALEVKPVRSKSYRNRFIGVSALG
jgi:hypothetical protein